MPVILCSASSAIRPCSIVPYAVPAYAGTPHSPRRDPPGRGAGSHMCAAWDPVSALPRPGNARKFQVDQRGDQRCRTRHQSDGINTVDAGDPAARPPLMRGGDISAADASSDTTRARSPISADQRPSRGGPARLLAGSWVLGARPEAGDGRVRPARAGRSRRGRPRPSAATGDPTSNARRHILGLSAISENACASIRPGRVPSR